MWSDSIVQKHAGDQECPKCVGVIDPAGESTTESDDS
jgi:hypothetical protein